MSVAVVIPVYNNLALTRACLDSLARCLSGLEIVVVDDASTDETPQAIPAQYPYVRFVRQAQNEGFASAANLGAAHASGDTILFLNNDTVAEGDFLAPLLRRLHSSPRVGLVQARLLYPDRTLQHAGMACGEDRVPVHLYLDLPEHFPPALKARRFQVANLACCVTPRAVFQQSGGFSTEYRNGFEDVDLCLRLGELGYEVWYEPESCLLHFEGKTRGAHAQNKNRDRFLARWASKLRVDIADYYQQDGIPRPLWSFFTTVRSPLRNWPLTWVLSDRTTPRVRTLVTQFAHHMASNLGVSVDVSTVDAPFRGAQAFLNDQVELLSTRVYVGEVADDAPEASDAVWMVDATGVHPADRPIPSHWRDMAEHWQILALAYESQANSPYTLLLRGRQMLARGDDHAAGFASACLSQFPNDPSALLLAGDVHWASGDTGAALEYYERAAPSLQPEYVTLRMAQALLARSPAAARRKLQGILKTNPLHKQALVLWANSHWRR